MSSRRPKQPARKKLQPLAAFMHAKVQAACPVCQLPEAIRVQLGPAAARKGFTRADQVEWLRVVCGVAGVTVDVLNRHFNGRHDQEVSDGQS